MKRRRERGSLHIPEVNDPYRQLGFAVVLQACDDYEDLLRMESKGFRIPYDLKDVRKWLSSPEPEYLSGIPGKIIMAKLRESFRREVLCGSRR